MVFIPTRLQKETIWLTKYLICKNFKFSCKSRELKFFNNAIHNLNSVWFTRLQKIYSVADIQNYIEDYFEQRMNENQFFNFINLGWILDEDHVWIIEDCFNTFFEFENWFNENWINEKFWDKSIDSLKPKKLFGYKWNTLKRQFLKKQNNGSLIINNLFNGGLNYSDEYCYLEAIKQMFPMITKINKLWLKQALKLQQLSDLKSSVSLNQEPKPTITNLKK